MKVSYLRLVVIMFVLLMQQACIIPAAVDAMQRYTHYNIVTTEQIDEKNFYTLISIEHLRGRFNPLGDHGGPTVTTGMDYQLWHLKIIDENLSATLLDEIKLKSEEEIDKWSYTIENTMLDKVNGKLLNLAKAELYDRHIYYIKNLRLNTQQNKVYGVVGNKNCSVDLPSNVREWKWGRQLLANEAGTHLMIADEVEKSLQITILEVCNKNRKIELNQSLYDVTEFSVYPNGSIEWIAGSSIDRKREYGHEKSYEAVLYPHKERLLINEDKLDLPNHFAPPRVFIFEEKSKRFHWLHFPKYDSSEIQLITHDFKSGVTSHRDVQLKPGRKNETTRTKI